MSKTPVISDALNMSEVIKRKLHEKGITQADLANRLGLCRSAITKALVRPNGMQNHVDKMAALFKCPTSDFAPPTGLREHLLSLLGSEVNQGEVRLPGGCALKEVPPELRKTVGGGWMLLQATSISPRNGALVYLVTTSGKEYVRRFFRDAEDPTMVVLTSALPGAPGRAEDTPVSLKEAKIAEVRMVIAPLAAPLAALPSQL